MRTFVIVTAASVLAALAAGACAGKGGASQSPARCMSSCEADCPSKGSSGHEFERYLACLDECEATCKAGAAADDEAS